MITNVVQTYSEDDMRKVLRSAGYRKTIGNALAQAYQLVPWLVDVNIDGGVATITCPNISAKYGMVIHLTRDTMALEDAAKRMGGELLERFNVSRSTGDFSGVKRRIDGEARFAAAGEQ